MKDHRLKQVLPGKFKMPFFLHPGSQVRADMPLLSSFLRAQARLPKERHPATILVHHARSSSVPFGNSLHSFMAALS